MNVTALAQVVGESGRSNHRISVQQLKDRLLMAGLDELADALLALYNGLTPSQDRRDGPTHPWF